jgi:hypothetical protein
MRAHSVEAASFHDVDLILASVLATTVATMYCDTGPSVDATMINCMACRSEERCEQASHSSMARLQRLDNSNHGCSSTVASLRPNQNQVKRPVINGFRSSGEFGNMFVAMSIVIRQ